MLLNKSKTVVVKIGSSLLIDQNNQIRKKWLSGFSADIKDLINQKERHNCKLWSNCTWL